MSVSLNSCKKLLGLDPESLLSKDPWIAKKEIISENGQEDTYTFEPDELVVEFYKKNHEYKVYEYGNPGETGTWSYDKKNKILTFIPESEDDRMETKVLELTKTELILRIEIDENDNGYPEIHTLYLEH
jgi:hypothetical protein